MRRSVVDMDDRTLSISQQAELLGVVRSSLYYTPQPAKPEDLRIKALIDRIYTDHPELGYRKICAWLRRYDNVIVNHKAVLRHMQEMGIHAIVPGKNTSKPNPEHKIYPYLLTGLEIIRPNQVWSVDITYIPIKTSFLYLVAIVDWYSRYVVSYAIDDTLGIDFVLECAKKSLQQATPEIMNSDQGSQFTSPQFTELYLSEGSKISMDHKGRAYDNIFIERLWRSVKYEDVYLKQYESPREARNGIREYMVYYNEKRQHQSLDYNTPCDIHLGKVLLPEPTLKPRGKTDKGKAKQRTPEASDKPQ